MIKFVNLKKSFGNREILKGISFEIKKGEIVFILGTSGTGKSVLLKNLVGLLSPDSGEIWVDGENIVEKTEDEFFEIRKKVGMVFQQPALFDSMSVFDNIAFGLKRLEGLEGAILKTRTLESLSHVGLKDLAHRYPSTLSYGQQKRVSLARSIAVKPQVLLFDEPTTGLDPVSTTSVNNLIETLSQKLHTTSIIVSHDMRCALSIANRIIVLDKGYLIADETPQKIKHNSHPLIEDFLKEALLEGHSL
jgi:phospholipid/cholesterol/gamma-HCH transport system ATP-binding protein